MRWIATRSRLTLAAMAALAVLALALGAGFLGTVHPAFDAFSHLRVYVAVLMIVAALPLLITDDLKVGALGIAIAGVAIATTSASVPIPSLGPAYGPLHRAEIGEPVYTLLQLNLRFDNAEKERVLSLIGRVGPDVVTLNEVSDPWAEKLKLIAAAYPYSIRCPFEEGVWGVAILSRRPFVAGSAPHCDRRGAFAIANIDFGGQSLHIAALHLGWPWPFEQAWQLRGLADMLGTLGDNSLLAGDMNAVPWSATVAHVAKLSHLSLLPSAGPTFLPRMLPEWLRFAGLPIDQVFAGKAALVQSITRLDAVGSDHLPVLVRFSLRPPPKAPGEAATASAEFPEPVVR